MELVYMALALVVLTILYARMVKRETPVPVGKAQAVVPVLLGLLSVVAALVLMLLIGLSLYALGLANDGSGNLMLSAVRSAFLQAGLTEEVCKLGFILVAIAVFRPKNVYEYILAGAGVGFGFTLLEEFAYSGGAAVLGRIITLAMHMAFGVVMARHLGMARHNKLKGEGPVARENVLALAVPVVLHTVYDACTANNPIFERTDELSEAALAAGLGAGIVAVVAFAIWQVVVLVKLKKNAGAYCEIPTQA